MEKGLRAVVFGGTGAVGKTLVGQLVKSPKWSKVLCVIRKQPQEWNQMVADGKLAVQIEPDMDRMLKPEEWKLEGFDAMFVCFGSQVKHGEDTFTKIDKTYPLMAADMAIKNKIPHYLIVSSAGSDSSSMFLYMRIKGQLEQELKQKKVNMISVLKPGLIKNRPDARTGEKVAQFFSFIPFSQIECSDLALSMRGIAETKVEEAYKSEGAYKIYTNDELNQFCRHYQKNQ